MKRVLLTTYPGAFLHHGGGEREIHLLGEALNSAGILADIYGPASQPIRAYQAIIHFSMIGGSELLLDEAARTGGHRLILWPNLWFVKEPTAFHLGQLSDFLSRFEAVVFKSHAEEMHFRNYLDLEGKDVIRIAPLISPRFQRQNVSTVFKESYGLGRYALWTGIIEPQKNQLLAVQAFSGLDIDLVISGEVRDAAYAEECRRQAGANIRFIPAMPFGSELHLSALSHCNLFVELPLDFPGSSAVEAATAGCRMLLSRSDWTNEVVGSFCTQIDPRDVEAIRVAVCDMLQQPDTSRSAYPVVGMVKALEGLMGYLEIVS